MACSLWLNPAANAQCAYQIEYTVATPTCAWGSRVVAAPTAINNRCEVVGTLYDCFGFHERPFYWSARSGLVLPVLPATYLSAEFNDINDSGQITGNRVVANSGLGSEAILYQDGNWFGLETMPSGNWSDGLAISSDGTIVGYWMNSATGAQQACIWSRGAIFDLGPMLGAERSVALDVSPSGTIVGFVASSLPYTEQGFVIQEDGTTLLPPLAGMLNSKADRVSASGSIIVYADLASGVPYQQSLVLADDSLELLAPIPPGVGVVATGIDAEGRVLGFNYSKDAHEAVIFIGGVVHVLADLVVSEQRVAIADGVMNDDGWIAAVLDFGSSHVTALLRPILPAPGDFDNDCAVGTSDLGLLLDAWGPGPSPADLDFDGVVGPSDLGLLLGEWSAP